MTQQEFLHHFVELFKNSDIPSIDIKSTVAVTKAIEKKVSMSIQRLFYVYGEGESPENSDDALAEDYLGQSGQSYDKLFVPVGSGGLGGEGGIIGSIPIGSI